MDYNQNIVSYLTSFATFYLFEKDRGRTTSFISAAEKVSTLPYALTSENFKSFSAKGIGNSILKEIELFLENKKSDRHQKLSAKWPNSSYVQLLKLFNFDLQYILHLWDKYKCDSIVSLKNINEHRVQLALSKIDLLNKQALSFDHSDQIRYLHLGDVASTRFYNLCSIDTICQQKKALNHKYIFTADFLPSPNTLSDLESERVDSWFLEVKKAQIKYGIKIWTGALVDIDLSGKPLLKKEHSKYDFFILHISTEPHTNKSDRLINALDFFSNKEKVVISCIDSYTEINELHQICSKIENILITSDILKLSLDDLFFYKKNLLVAGDFLNKENVTNYVYSFLSTIGVTQQQIINSYARPFQKKITTNTVGIK